MGPLTLQGPTVGLRHLAGREAEGGVGSGGQMGNERQVPTEVMSSCQLEQEIKNSM